MIYQREMSEKDEIHEIRFELCAGWQMEGQVKYLREFIGQHKPEVSDRLVFTEYNDTRFQKVLIWPFSHVETADSGSNYGIRRFDKFWSSLGNLFHITRYPSFHL